MIVFDYAAIAARLNKLTLGEPPMSKPKPPVPCAEVADHMARDPAFRKIFAAPSLSYEEATAAIERWRGRRPRVLYTYDANGNRQHFFVGMEPFA